MKIFDGHSHISDKTYDLNVAFRNIIFNDISEYNAFDSQADCISIIFDYKNYDINSLIKSDPRIKAIKIHSRLQSLNRKGFTDLLSELKKLNLDLPIIYDAFYYGPELEFAPRIADVVDLSEQFPDVPIIVAHSGGHKVLDYFYHLRPLSNVHYCISNSLPYLKGSSSFLDFIHLIKYTPSDKILFGSDFPYCSPSHTYDLLMDIFKSLQLDQAHQESILYSNCLRLFALI